MEGKLKATNFSLLFVPLCKNCSLNMPEILNPTKNDWKSDTSNFEAVDDITTNNILWFKFGNLVDMV